MNNSENKTKPLDITSNSNLTSTSSFCKTPPNSPWGNHSASSFSYIHKITPFEEVMSEQLANELHLHDITETVQPYDDQQPSGSQDAFTTETAVEDTSNDAVLAQMLQANFDMEYNSYLKKQENHINKNCKVQISFEKYKTDEMFQEDVISDDEDDEFYLLPKEERNSQGAHKMTFNKKGYTKFGNEVVTKHDTEINGRKNTAKLEDSMPPDFLTGDARGMDLLLSNKNYNSLKRHAYSDQQRSSKNRENKDTSTAMHAFDDKTKLILSRIVDRGFINEVNGVISKGKEAVVLHADGGDVAEATNNTKTGLRGNKNDFEFFPSDIPKELAIKVYQTTLAAYRCRDKYIKDDFRFKNRYKKLTDRKITYMWAEKEMYNLQRIKQAEIPCPRVILLRKHVLVMSFIGSQNKSAPQLKSAHLSHAQQTSAYNQVVDIMKKMYHKCSLVHGDLNEYNLLWHNNKVWVIDVSQSVEPSHPNALEFLLRDCKNISKFFRKLNVENVLLPLELFNLVSGYDLSVDDEQEFIIRMEEIQRESHEHAMKRSRCCEGLHKDSSA